MILSHKKEPLWALFFYGENCAETTSALMACPMMKSPFLLFENTLSYKREKRGRNGTNSRFYGVNGQECPL